MAPIHFHFSSEIRPDLGPIKTAVASVHPHSTPDSTKWNPFIWSDNNSFISIFYFNLLFIPCVWAVCLQEPIYSNIHFLTNTKCVCLLKSVRYFFNIDLSLLQFRFKSIYFNDENHFSSQIALLVGLVLLLDCVRAGFTRYGFGD
jgi:hypothetical protein